MKSILRAIYITPGIMNIGITHVFSCINICWVLRKLFEHEAVRPSVQHRLRDLTSVNSMKHNVIDAHNVFANKTIGKMISQGCNAFLYNVIQTNEGPNRLRKVKSHVQTAHESHDLNIVICGFKQLRVTNSYARIYFYRSV